MKQQIILKRILKISSAAAMSACIIAMSGCYSQTQGGGTPATIEGLTNISVEAGETYRFLNVASSDGASLAWASSNEKIAEVEVTYGVATLTAISSGTAEITAYTSTAQATCTVTITSDGSSASSVTVDISDYLVDVESGESATLTAASSNGESVYWYSTDESVATVSGGVVTGVADGTAYIVACNSCAQTECVAAVNSSGTIAVDESKTLVWSDEFEGDSLDESKWTYQTGTHDVYHGNASSTSRWGNNEQQYYTKDAVSVSGGCLNITATKQQKEDCSYTSARILTRDLYSVTYGYIEARMKLPAITGMWPAFWMLPQPSDYTSTHNVYGGWSQSGEIDIMEARGRLLNTTCGTLHYGSSEYLGYDFYFDGGTSIVNWHTYAVEWREDHISWYVDGEEYFTMQSSEWYTSASSNDAAPFDQPFYILLNLAVGGNFDGNNLPPDGFSSAAMYVDYVRVYA